MYLSKIILALALVGSPAFSGQISVVNPSGIVSVTVSVSTPTPVAPSVSGASSSAAPISGSPALAKDMQFGNSSPMLAGLSAALSSLEVSSFSSEERAMLIERVDILLQMPGISEQRRAILVRERARLGG